MGIELGIKILESVAKWQAQEESKRALKLVIANQAEAIAELKNISGDVGGIRAALDALLATDMLTAMALLERASMEQRQEVHRLADFREARILLLRVLSTNPDARTPMQVALLHRSIALAALGIGDYAGAADELNRAEKYLIEELKPLADELELLRGKAYSELRALPFQHFLIGILPPLVTFGLREGKLKIPDEQAEAKNQISRVLAEMGDDPSWDAIDHAVESLSNIEGRPVKIPSSLRTGISKRRRASLVQAIATIERLLFATKQLRDAVTTAKEAPKRLEAEKEQGAREPSSPV